MGSIYNFDKTFPGNTYSDKNPGVLSDVYQLHKTEIQERDKVMGTKTGMVDMNAACVWDKADYGNGLTPVNLSEVQENIHERFGMQSVSDFKEDTNEGGDY